METIRKLEILSDAAKYDVSCSSSGSARAAAPGGLGNAAPAGICHAFSADGRCISLLKVLLSNACAYDCAYCVNRRSNDVPRAGFEPEELVRLVIDFYRRNYIEGAFLSSGVAGCPDATMERLIAVARILRTRERWNGYLHLKAIPGSSRELVEEAARWADRVSVNIELPSAASLARVAPDKNPAAIFGVMRTLARASGFEPRRLVGAAQASLPRAASGQALAERPYPQLPAAGGVDAASLAAEPAPAYAPPSVMAARRSRRRDPLSATLPAGQTTQLVVGASPESDAAILSLAENLYLAYDVRRVYYSAFVPVSPDPRVPALGAPPLLREHRLYQADWLFRFYGFRAEEILSPERPNLESAVDPKCAWALRNPGYFPIDVNAADYLELLRVPGIGPVSASRILKARRQARLRPEALARLGVVMKRAAYFVTCSGLVPEGLPPAARRTIDPATCGAALADGAARLFGPRQLEFDWGADA